MSDELAETWKSIADFPNYEISSHGRLRNVNSGKMLSPSPDRNGYLVVFLRRDGNDYPRYVHRLVLEAFVGKPRRKKETSFIDDNRANCRIDNLEWATKSDKYKGFNTGHKNPRAALTGTQATAIRYRALAGETLQALSDEYHVSVPTISQIKNRRTYKQDYCTNCGQPCYDYLCERCI